MGLDWDTDYMMGSFGINGSRRRREKLSHRALQPDEIINPDGTVFRFENGRYEQVRSRSNASCSYEFQELHDSVAKFADAIDDMFVHGVK